MGRAVRWYSLLSYWTPVLIWMIVIFTCSSFSRIPDPGGFQIGDKLKHFGAYAVLGALAYRAIRGAVPQCSLRDSAAAVVLLVGVYGVMDEFHQYFVPGRRCELGDWLADLAGAVTVAAVVVIFNYSRGRDSYGGR